MNREDIIRMAREAEHLVIEDYYTNGPVRAFSEAQLERFAALVASAERESLRESFRVVTAAEASAAILHEREACAKECDIQASFGNDDERFGARQCGYAIRARGQA